MMTFALMLLAMQAAPQQGPYRVFGDWAVACDNVRRCEMTSLLPEDGDMAAEAPQVAIVRDAGPDGGVTIRVMADDASGQIGLKFASRIWATARPGPHGHIVTGEAAVSVATQMARGSDPIEIHDGDQSARISVKGASAALRFIDAEQGRAGTVSAIVAKGARPASAVPVAMPLPQIAYRRPTGQPEAVPPGVLAAMWTQSQCDENYDAGERPQADRHALGGGRTLVLIPCGNGAYNFASVAFVVEGGKAVAAQFDSSPGWTAAEGMATLVNAQFEPATGALTSYAKARGLGDCGSMERYVWDGAMFRLTEARGMGECRGSTNWLTVWRAQAVAKTGAK